MSEAYKFLHVSEQGLGRRAWIADELSVADFALASTFMYRRPGDLVGKVSCCRRMHSRLEARDSWRRGALRSRNEWVSDDR